MTGIIYRITNTYNGYCYIGSTLNERERLARHMRHLRKGKHVNKLMQEHFNECGESYFLVEVITRDVPEKELYIHEMAAIYAAQDEHDERVYNISKASRISPKKRQEVKQKNLLRKMFKYNRGNKRQKEDDE